MTHLEEQVIKLLEITGQSNVLDAIEYIKTLQQSSSVPQPDSAPSTGRSLVDDIELIKSILYRYMDSVYHCTRVWAAWNVGAMTEDDFQEVRDDDDFLTELSTAISQQISKDFVKKNTSAGPAGSSEGASEGMAEALRGLLSWSAHLPPAANNEIIKANEAIASLSPASNQTEGKPVISGSLPHDDEGLCSICKQELEEDEGRWGICIYCLDGKI